MPNKLTQFWKELRRRNVVRVITVYAGAAFVIIELINNVTEPLRLPDWTPTFVIVLLAIGFPIIIIFSWIYDVHPEGGMVKTEPDEEVQAEEITRSSNGWKIASYISFGVIVAMICILLYPKIFKSDQLKELRDEEGMISLAVLPFDNLTGDSALYFWQNGISEYLINRLGNSEELAVWSSQVVSDVLEGTRQVNAASLTPEIARKTASKIDASTYITGNFIGKEKDASIMLNLVNTESGELIWSTRLDGDLGNNYRSVLNRLSDTVRNYLEIKAIEEQVESDLTNAYPNSSEAYRYYIDGLNAIMNGDYKTAIESLSEAYEIDSTFTFAAFYLAYSYCFNNQFDENLIHWTSRAHELQENLPPVYRPWIELWYACIITKDIDDIRRYCDLMYNAALHSRFLFFDLGVTYSSFMDNYTKSIEAYEKIEALNELWQDNWRYERYYQSYAWTLLMAERPDDAARIIAKGLKVNPDNDWLKLAQGAVHIMKGDSTGVKASEEWLRGNVRDSGYGPKYEEHYMGVMYCWAKDSLTAAGYFRKAWELDPEKINSLYFLIVCQLESNVNLEECLQLAECRIEKMPESEVSLSLKGACLCRLGRYEEALPLLNKAYEQWVGYNKDIVKYIHEAEQALSRQARL